MYVNRGFRRCDFVARTGFDFDEGECERARRFVIRDDFNLACDLATGAAITDRSNEIGRDYPVALPLEILRDQSLTVFSQREMRRRWRDSQVSAKLPEKFR